jgi:hypothetical protein
MGFLPKILKSIMRALRYFRLRIKALFLDVITALLFIFVNSIRLSAKALDSRVSAVFVLDISIELPTGSFW